MSGRGEIEVDLQFLANLCVTCPECHGRRYAPETLLVFYRNRNIHDVLQMTAEEAFAFFRNHPKIQRPLQLLRDVGLGYVTLGQPTASFSMGECQRLMLASSLSAASGKHRLYLFDEPASGLHPADLMVLVRAFQRLVEQGHSVVVIENDPQILSQADWIIEMGPGAHEKGGTVVYSGPPENWSGSV
ncbi:MAG: hypothetical protein KDA78_02235 [Planctomycetaceae bacterium]|nr:hypothetical protein [Planctomycetaceae bacterium]